MKEINKHTIKKYLNKFLKLTQEINKDTVSSVDRRIIYANITEKMVRFILNIEPTLMKEILATVIKESLEDRDSNGSNHTVH